MGFAGWKPSRIGEPWEAWEDAHIVEDWSYGCRALTIAMRARRTEAEVTARLLELGKSFEDQPKRRIRRIVGT